MKCLFLLVFVGCAGDVSKDPTMNADLDGAHWSATSATAVSNNGVLTLVGTDGATTVTMMALAQENTYSIANDSAASGELVQSAVHWTAFQNLGSGTITIDDINGAETVTGRFQLVVDPPNGSGLNMHSLSNGTFMLNF